MLPLGLIMFVVASALAYWARWLGRQHRSPRWVRWLPAVVLGSWAAGSAGCAYLLSSTFSQLASRGLDAASRQDALSRGIMHAMWSFAAVVIACAAMALTLLALTWRYHWKADEAPTGNPPYR